MQVSDLKHCPICTNDLPVSEFGICRARKDGKNLYCKDCIREKVSRQRAQIREMKMNRRGALIATGVIENKPWVVVDPVHRDPVHRDPITKVLEVIRNGARTQAQIGFRTKLRKDVIGDVLAELILDRGEVVSQSVGDRRYYFIREVEEQPERKDCVLSLNCLGPVIKHERVA